MVSLRRIVARFLAATEGLDWVTKGDNLIAKSPASGFYHIQKVEPYGWDTFWSEDSDPKDYARTPILSTGYPRTTGGARNRSYFKTPEDGKRACAKHLKLVQSKEGPVTGVKLTPGQKRFLTDAYKRGEPDVYDPTTNRMLGPLQEMGLFRGWSMTDRGKELAEHLLKQ